MLLGVQDITRNGDSLRGGLNPVLSQECLIFELHVLRYGLKIDAVNPSGPDNPYELAHRVLGLDRVAQRQVLIHLVVGSASVARSDDDTGLLQLSKNSLHCTLGDAYSLRDFADANVWVSHDADQDVSVITQESPCRGVFLGRFGIHMTSFT